MDSHLKEIVVAYFNGGNAVSNNISKKLPTEIKQDLNVIRDFYQELDTQQK